MPPFLTSLFTPATVPSGPQEILNLIKHAEGSRVVWSALNLPSPAACQAFSVVSSRLHVLMGKVASPPGAAALQKATRAPPASRGLGEDTLCQPLCVAFKDCLASHHPAA